MPDSRPGTIQAVLAVIERRGRYLICRRKRGGFLGGYWEFPGGKREPGEPWKACLRREVREELGVALGQLKWWGRLRHRYQRKTFEFNVFRCSIVRGTPRPLAARALRWVSAAQFGRYRFPPANRPLIARLGGKLPRPRAGGIISSKIT